METAGHYLHSGEVVVDQDEAAAESVAGGACCAAACEEIEHDIAGIGGGDDDAAENSEGLLSGVSCLFAAVSGNDGVEPGVGGGLTARCFLGTDQAGRHVWDTVKCLSVEGIVAGVLHVDEDVIVLGRPLAASPRTIVVGPDHLVEEAFSPENAVEHDFAVVNFAVVYMKIEGAVGGEQAVSLLQARLEEGEVVVEGVVVGLGGEGDGGITATTEACAVARF